MLPHSTSLSLLLTIFITPLSLTSIIAPPLCNNDFEVRSTLGSVYNQYQPVICNATFNTQFSGNVNNSLEYIFVFPYNKEISLQPRVTVESKTAVHSKPLLVVVTQLTSILSWQVPLQYQNSSGGFIHNRVSRTLCPDDDQEDFGGTDNIVITISTRNNESVDFVLWVNKTEHFNVEHSKLYKIQVSTTEPQFFKFTFDQSMSSALIVVESADTSCMTLSIQNNSPGPIYINEHLTSHNKELLGYARRLMKERKLHYAGYHNGKILVKRRDGEQATRVSSRKV